MEISEEELKKRLTKEEYEVLRQKGTELPFSGKLLHDKRDGMYKCKVCGADLFSSDSKFESGTGWPSFDKAIPGSVLETPDDTHGMRRTEITCVNCGSHLGHVFPDGPTKTGMRYCLNSVCLDLEVKK
ncbi:MAG: peptide-methionine (R)-S-oxide reductase MsrB [Minisyncoccia bacterium]